MFDMSKIGRNIAELRKKAGLTQMGLADAMGISFQAVSNWERGRTMPDISKLPELAAILGVTVDGLLGGDEAQVVERALDESEEPLTVEEFADIAPILPPEEARRNFERTREESRQRGRRIRLSELSELAPFLDEDDLGELVLDALDRECELEELTEFAPFLDGDVIAAAVLKLLKLGADPGGLANLAPFMDSDGVGEAARAVLMAGGVPGDLVDLAPFMDEDDVGDLAREFLRRGGAPSDLAALAPFMDSDDLGALVRDYIKDGGDISEMIGLGPFLRGGRSFTINLGSLRFGRGKDKKKRPGQEE